MTVMTIEGSSCHEILKVFMVTKYLSLVLCASKIMSPFLECYDNGQHFLTVDLIVNFCRGEFWEREGNWLWVLVRSWL